MPQIGEGRTAQMQRLTPQERECLRLVAEQRSSKEIAHELGISKASVDTYCNRARAKLGVSSRREAARIVRALDAGGANPPAPAPEPAFQPPPPPPAAPMPAPPARTSWFAALGPVQRLWVILMGASFFALAFGVLVNGLERLNHLMDALPDR